MAYFRTSCKGCDFCEKGQEIAKNFSKDLKTFLFFLRQSMSGRSILDTWLGSKYDSVSIVYAAGERGVGIFKLPTETVIFILQVKILRYVGWFLELWKKWPKVVLRLWLKYLKNTCEGVFIKLYIEILQLYWKRQSFSNSLIPSKVSTIYSKSLFSTKYCVCSV